jgi:hypothetical protein
MLKAARHETCPPWLELAMARSCSRRDNAVEVGVKESYRIRLGEGHTMRTLREGGIPRGLADGVPPSRSRRAATTAEASVGAQCCRFDPTFVFLLRP